VTGRRWRAPRTACRCTGRAAWAAAAFGLCSGQDEVGFRRWAFSALGLGVWSKVMTMYKVDTPYRGYIPFTVYIPYIQFLTYTSYIPC